MSWLERAVALAYTSSCNYQHCAMVVRNGKVLSAKTNRYRNATIARTVEEVKTLSYHAEYRAIRAAGIENCRGATIVVARVNATGPALSKPCKHCAELIRTVGIKRIIYTN